MMRPARPSKRCEWLDWHRPSTHQTFDGCSLGSRCARCDRRILQDSQGNWFSVGERPA